MTLISKLGILVGMGASFVLVHTSGAEIVWEKREVSLKIEEILKGGVVTFKGVNKGKTAVVLSKLSLLDGGGRLYASSLEVGVEETFMIYFWLDGNLRGGRSSAGCSVDSFDGRETMRHSLGVKLEEPEGISLFPGFFLYPEFGSPSKIVVTVPSSFEAGMETARVNPPVDGLKLEVTKRKESWEIQLEKKVDFVLPEGQEVFVHLGLKKSGVDDLLWISIPVLTSEALGF